MLHQFQAGVAAVMITFWCMLVFVLSAPLCAAAPQQKTDESEIQERIAALIQAIDIHDRSIRSMHWRQEVTFDTEQGQQLLNASEYAFDRQGRWCSRGRQYFRKPDGTFGFISTRYAYDGAVMRTLHVENNAGTIRPFEIERSMIGPEMLLGRSFDYMGRRRLCEVLRSAESIGLESRDGLPVLVADVLMADRKWMTVRVTVDPRHGFAPVEIAGYEGVYLSLKEVFRTTEFKVIEGIHVPIAGYRVTYVIDPPAEDKVAECNRRLASLGLPEEPDVSDPQIRDVVRGIVADVFGPEGLPTRLIHRDLPQRLRVLEIMSFNQALDEDLFTLQLPEGAIVNDRFTGESLRIRDGVAISNPEPGS